MKMDREVRKVAKQLGFALSPTRGGHVKAERPDTQTVFLPSTASDHRARKNGIAQLRRAAVGRPL